MSRQGYFDKFARRSSSRHSYTSRLLSSQPENSSPAPVGRGSLQRSLSPAPDIEDRKPVHFSQELRTLRNINDDEEESGDRHRKRRKTNSVTQPGRGIRKIVDLYHDLPVLVDKARAHTARKLLRPEELREVDRQESAGLTEDEIKERRKDRQRCHKAIQLLNKLIPGFEARAIAAEDIESFCAPLQAGANDARSDDTSRLKVAIAEWLNSRGDPNTRISSRNKLERGISNDATGRLICPIDYDWDDPEVRAKLRTSAPGYSMGSHFFLRCLYEREDGDIRYPEDGFLKGPLLVRAYRHIFTSPSSATNEDVTVITSRRRDVATTLRLDGRVTPRSIAYAATQLVFALNSSRDWKKEHGGIHYPSFYDFLVDFFENPDSDNEGSEHVDNEYGNELLRWWNRKIFPARNSQSGSALSNARQASKNSHQRLREARARHTRF